MEHAVLLDITHEPPLETRPCLRRAVAAAAIRALGERVAKILAAYEEIVFAIVDARWITLLAIIILAIRTAYLSGVEST
jgi:hypothetical protein